MSGCDCEELWRDWWWRETAGVWCGTIASSERQQSLDILVMRRSTSIYC